MEKDKKYIDVEGANVEDAIKKALKKLNVTRDEINVKVVCEEKKGLFGIVFKQEYRVSNLEFRLITFIHLEHFAVSKRDVFIAGNCYRRVVLGIPLIWVWHGFHTQKHLVHGYRLPLTFAFAR